MEKMEWEVGETIAYFCDRQWNISKIAKLTATQCVLENEKRFRQSDGYLLGMRTKGSSIRVSKFKKVENEIANWNKNRMEEKKLASQKARLRDLIHKIQGGYFWRLNPEDIEAIADCIENILKQKEKE